MRPTDADDGRPALRALEIQHHDGPDGPGILLIDRLGISTPTFVPAALLPIVGRCDGTRSLSVIRREASRQLGVALSAATVEQLVRQLDQHGLLLGPRFDAAVRAAAAGFLAARSRPARHAGSAGCPADGAQLTTTLQELVGAPAGRGAPVRGLVAPHLDLARGHAGYRAAYRRLLAAPLADLYVVFGTGHGGPAAPVTGLPLDWDTPLGTAPTDHAFVAAVHAAIGAAAPADLLLHRDEHSIEFQVLLLQHVHACRRAPAPRIAGFLCGALPSGDGDPLAEPWCRRLLDAFRAAATATEGRVCHVAGADLSHIGPLFGDIDPVDTVRLQRLAAADLGFLADLQRGAPGDFHRAVAATGNPDRICSAPAITLCAALAGGAAELLHYGQARADDGSQTVSFCAMAFSG
jgi:hypothetical protein